MKKILLALILSSSLCTQSNALPAKNYSQLFKPYEACFLLYDLNQEKLISEYNPKKRCQERLSPDSTFKIALSLMAFNEDLMQQDTVFKWDGHKASLPNWNQDQTPQSWLKYSTVWVSQRLTPKLGYSHIKNYLALFHYGNQDFSGDPGKANGLQYAWLSSSLKISAQEQLQFLKAFLKHQLPLHESAIENTKKNLYLGQLAQGAALYGKTGSGRHGHNERETNPSRLRDGWFVGFIEKGEQRYIFVSNLTDKIPLKPDKDSSTLQPYGSQVLKPIILTLLNDNIYT